MSIKRTMYRHALLRAVACGLLAAPVLTLQAADPPKPGISDGMQFVEQDGEGLYRAVCQSCHMPDGQGAQGAGMYPALAKNPKLAAGAYPVINILHGRKGMPTFAAYLSDAQVAAVTNYVRTHMGNHYTNAVTVAEVKALR